ncbi:MAG: hypothetical protein ABJC89_22715, partial [Acidobacteriota bacterium]
MPSSGDRVQGGGVGPALPAGEDRQALRMRRYLIAAGTSLMVIILLWAAYWFGGLSRSGREQGTALILFLTNASVMACIREVVPMRSFGVVALLLLVLTASACHKGPLATRPASNAAGSGDVASSSPRTPPAPVSPIRLGRGGVPGIPYPRQTKNVNAVYPPEAQRARAQGMVFIEITIDPASKIS